MKPEPLKGKCCYQDYHDERCSCLFGKKSVRSAVEYKKMLMKKKMIRAFIYDVNHKRITEEQLIEIIMNNEESSCEEAFEDVMEEKA